MLDPPVSKLIALADAFGVYSSYFLCASSDSAVFDEGLIGAVSDETIKDIVRETLRVSERERSLILNVVR